MNHLNATVRWTVAADGWTEANHNFAPAEQNANKSAGSSDRNCVNRDIQAVFFYVPVTGIDLHWGDGDRDRSTFSPVGRKLRWPPVFALVAADVHRTSAFGWVRSRSLHTKKSTPVGVLFLVPVTGIEPVRILLRGILSPLCLPVPPHRRGGLTAMVSHFASTVKGHSWSRFSANAGRHSSMNQFSSGRSISFMACMVCTAAELNSVLPAFCSSIHLA